MSDNMKADLCVKAFLSATTKYKASGMIFHSDRISQYTSNIYRKTLAQHKAIQSMSSTGRCYDNARMESFGATLTKELLGKHKTETISMNTLKSMIFRYIETYYNRKRIYTPNGGLPPLRFRERYYSEQIKEAI